MINQEERRWLERKAKKRQEEAAFTTGWRVIWSGWKGQMVTYRKDSRSKAVKKAERKARIVNALLENGQYNPWRKVDNPAHILLTEQ